MLPTPRASYALVYINSFFIGVYFMSEDMSGDFMAARLEGDDGNGNLMKLNYQVYLQYFGDDVKYYQDLSHSNALNATIYDYEQDDGNGDWTVSSLVS